MFIRFNVFRSSGFIPKRMLETSISEQIAKNLITNLTDLSDFLKDLRSPRVANPNIRRRRQRIGIKNAREFLMTQITIYEKVKDANDPKTYGEKKRKMHYGLKKVIEISKNLQISDGETGGVTTLWEMIQTIERFNFSKKS